MGKWLSDLKKTRKAATLSKEKDEYLRAVAAIKASARSGANSCTYTFFFPDVVDPVIDRLYSEGVKYRVICGKQGSHKPTFEFSGW